MIYVLLFGFCVAFIELFSFLDLRRQVTAMTERSREAMRVLASSDLSDHDKEAFVRKASLAMLEATVTFTLKLGAIIASLYLIYLAVVAAFPALEQGLLESFVSPAIVLALTVAAIAYAWARDAVVKHL